jgi:Uma2 family endonuclease
MTVKLEEPQVKRWTRSEYYRLAAKGYFTNQRVQLIEGEIIEMPPQGHAHTKAIFAARKFLESAFVGDFWIREEKPLNVGRHSDPEPDLAVVAGLPESFDDHPTTSLAVIEIADSSLRLDRKKAGLYASAGVAEHWIVNLTDRKLETYCDPVVDSTESFGHRYRDVSELKPDDKAQLKLNPAVTLNVGELFV